jgi:hypothetical protein
MPSNNSSKRTLRVAAAYLVWIAVPFAFLQAQDSSTQQPAHHVAAMYRLGGQPTGTYHESTSPEPDGGGVTSIESDLVFNRLGTKLEMKSTSQYHEDRDGHLTSVASDQSSSQQSTHLAVRVGEGSLAITTTTGGKSYEHSAPFTGLLLGPDGARRLLLARLHQSGDSVSYQTFSAEMGSVTTISSKLVATDDDVVIAQEKMGQRKISGLKIEQTVESMPGTSTLWLDRDGWLLRQVVQSPLGEIEALREEGAPTEASATRGASLPEETFTRSIVKANIRLPNERLIEGLKLKIIHERPELGWPELETDNQHVLEKTPNYVVLEVKRIEPHSAASAPAANDSASAPYLAPNALLQSDDAAIKAIASSVVGNEHDAWRAAQALQRWTNDNMEFDLGIAIAPASEVARNRRGTCFGYSMLLGSLARAAGIPSRLRMGYVYAGGIWGGHAWVEVRIGQDWIPVDGALYSPGAADAARFSFFTSALEEGTLGGVGALGQLFSNVDIKILQYTVGGKRIDVPEDAEPFTVSGKDYRNPWIGLSIRKPSAFKFVDVDAAWPQTDLVSMEGPHGESIKVKNLSASLPTGEFDAEKEFTEEGIHGQHGSMLLAGRESVFASSGQKAEAVLVSRGNIWALTSAGPDAKQLLKQVAHTMRLTD